MQNLNSYIYINRDVKQVRTHRLSLSYAIDNNDKSPFALRYISQKQSYITLPNLWWFLSYMFSCWYIAQKLWYSSLPKYIVYNSSLQNIIIRSLLNVSVLVKAGLAPTQLSKGALRELIKAKKKETKKTTTKRKIWEFISVIPVTSTNVHWYIN